MRLFSIGRQENSAYFLLAVKKTNATVFLLDGKKTVPIFYWL
jgi:hypothetical protein